MAYASLERFRDITGRNVLALQQAKEAGKKVVGQYCIYSPLEIALAEATPLSFAGNPLTLSSETALFDDPVNRAGALCTLPTGTAVSVLVESGYRMLYVETEKDGARCRGFIEIN